MHQNQGTGGLESVLVRTSFREEIYPVDRLVIAHPREALHRGSLRYPNIIASYAHSPREIQPCSESLNSTRISSLADSYELKEAGRLEEGDHLVMDRVDLELRSLDGVSRFSDGSRGVFRALTGADEIGLADMLASEGRDYLAAKDVLFMDFRGRAVPRFQYEILSAAVNMGIAGRDVLDKLAEGTLSQPDISYAADYLFREYDRLCDRDGEPELTEDSRRARGTFLFYFLGSSRNPTSSPRDLDVLLGTALVMKHEPFMKMYNDAREKESCPDTFWGALNAFYNANRLRKLSRFRAYGAGRDELYDEYLYCEKVSYAVHLKKPAWRAPALSK